MAEVAATSRTVREYLVEWEQQDPVADGEEHPVAQEMVSKTDPDAARAVKRGPASLAYFDNYLMDMNSRVILSVEATPARFRQETLAARIEALFAELKQQIRLRRMRLRRTWQVAEQFLLTAAAQNLKRMVRFLAHCEALKLSTT